MEENLHGYQELLKLDPDDAKYKKKVKSYSEVTYSQLNPSLPPARWNYSVERIEWLNKKKTKVKVLVRAERNYRYWGTDWYYYKEDSNGNWHMTLANGTRGIYGE